MLLKKNLIDWEIKLDSCIGQNQLSQLSFCMFTSKIRPCEVDEWLETLVKYLY